MFKNEYTLTVDLKKKMTSAMPTFVQYDSAELVFKVFDDGKKYDLTGFTKAEVSHRKSDGTVVVGIATIEGSGMNQSIRYVYKGSEMSKIGYVETSLTLYSATKKVTIQPFKVLIVIDLLEEYASPANPEVGALQVLIASVEALKAESITATNNANTQATHAKTQGDYAKTETNKMLTIKADIEASEVERVSNENTRKSSETTRGSNESTRKSNETSRVSAESSRVTAEDARKTAETTRITDENTRKTNETARISKETARVTAETDRATKESARIVAENARIADETSRKTVESARVTAETNRVSAENARATKESSRIADETTREQNETTRKAQETARQANTQTAITGANTARDDATAQANYAKQQGEIVQSIANDWKFAESHNMSTQYKKNNVVSFNGSSYIAIQNNTGKIPVGDVSDVNWRIIARKGEDGKGLVVLHKDVFTATEGQKVFKLSNEYDQLQNRLRVTVGSVEQYSPQDFMETSSNSFTLSSGVPAGAFVVAVYFGNAPAIVNDLQVQINSLNDVVQHMDFVEIRLAGDHAKIHGDVAKQAAIDANLARDNAITSTTKATTATSLTETATANANTATTNAVTATNSALDAADRANNAAVVAGTHTGDMTIHLTSIERTTWNNKETPTGAQDKATTAETNAKNYADSKVASLVGTAPETLDTLNELATALGNDPNFATTIATQIGGKVDKIVGKGLSTEDFTSTEKTKLTGIETGANKYTHPATHLPSIIAQDASNRFMTDTEKTKLIGIEAGANKYTHPANHPASIITQDPSNRMLSDAKIAELEAKETVSGSQTKADSARDVAKAYTDNQIASTTFVAKTDIFTATSNQSIFTLSGSYTVNQSRIAVIVGGVEQFSPINFTETSASSFTLSEGVPLGTQVIAKYSKGG